MSPAALDRAEAMGRRAGEFLAEFGIPSRCPFDPARQRELARAYARGYLAAGRSAAGAARAHPRGRKIFGQGR